MMPRQTLNASAIRQLDLLAHVAIPHLLEELIQHLPARSQQSPPDSFFNLVDDGAVTGRLFDEATQFQDLQPLPVRDLIRLGLRALGSPV